MGRIGARGAKLQLQSNRHEESGERGADKFPDEFAGLQAYNGLHASTGSSNLVAFQATRDRPRARAQILSLQEVYMLLRRVQLFPFARLNSRKNFFFAF